MPPEHRNCSPPALKLQSVVDFCVEGVLRSTTIEIVVSLRAHKRPAFQPLAAKHMGRTPLTQSVLKTHIDLYTKYIKMNHSC